MTVNVLTITSVVRISHTTVGLRANDAAKRCIAMFIYCKFTTFCHESIINSK